MAEFIEKKWVEITSRNPVSGKDFPQGLKNFKFSVGQGYGFIPSQSYFKVDLTIKQFDAAGDSEDVSNITYADGVCGNLFNNIYFNMGGQTVSSITTGLPQCDILKNRLTKSKAWNDTVGKTQGFDPLYQTRNADMNTDVTSITVTDPVFNTTNRASKSFMWQPAIGIFDVSQPLGAAEYDIQLNPSQDYRTAALDGGNVGVSIPLNAINPGYSGATGSLNTVDLIVENIKFYACMVRVNLPSSGVETLHLMEMSVHTGNVRAGNANNIDEEFSVPSSTRAMTLFLQDQQAGKSTSVPPSKYHIIGRNNEAISIQDYQIEYAGLTKPTVRYKSQYDANTLGIQQRYLNSALESGQYFNPAGFESLQEYMERGPFLHESFIKSADNLATRAHVVASYSANNTNDARIFLVAHHSRTVQITRQNGLVVNIVSLNT